MRMRVVLCMVFGLALSVPAEMRTWRARSGHQTEASFVSHEAGIVRLKRSDGEEISLRIEMLSPQDQAWILNAGSRPASSPGELTGALNEGLTEKPSGRRELTWNPLGPGDHWPEDMPTRTREALEALPRDWEHVETQFFIIHFQQTAFARRVARMADFQYHYIAADLPGFVDRQSRKSHIVVLRNRDDWQTFLQTGSSAPEWSAAYVQGMIMYMRDSGNLERDGNLLAHEMSHLVLNRFFVHRPPIWLNEGLAEWYESMGYTAFKGRRVNERTLMGRLREAMPLKTLTELSGYPENRDQVRLFYRTSRHVVGMLMLRENMPTFVRFLQGITVEGRPFTEPLASVYGINSLEEFQSEFDAFLR